MTEFTTKQAAESGHWYTRDADLVDQVEGKTTGRMRRPTVADARANGWLPGCTTIIRQAAAPALQRWSNKEHVKAATELGPPQEELPEHYFRRVNERASVVGREAAEIGSRIHGEIHSYLTRRIITASAVGIMSTVQTSVQDEWDRQVPDMPKVDFHWRSEDPVMHWLGYATKADLWSPARSGVLLDFKGKKSVDDFPDGLYDEHLMQLAATRTAIEHTHGKTIADCGIVFFSRLPGEAGLAKVVWADDEEVSRGGRMYRALLEYWQAKYRYDSGWEPHDNE